MTILGRLLGQLEGHVDRFDGAELHGWAWDPRRPGERVSLDVFARGIFLGQASAGFHRPDLEALGMGDGCHGFRARIPGDVGSLVLDDIRIAPITPKNMRLGRAGAAPALSAPAPAPSRGDRYESIRSFFGPLLAHLATTETGPIEKLGPRPGRALDPLFQVRPDSDPPLSDFARHVAAKFGRIGADGWTGRDRESFAAWYVGDYGVAKGPARLPLCGEEIDYWTDAIAGPRSRRKVSARSGRTGDSRDVYHWAVEDSRRLWMEDCLVADRDIALLRADAKTRRRETSFPLSTFMAAFMQRNGLFARLPRSTPEDRHLVYAVVLLYALRMPHLLMYVPATGLRAMFDDRSGPFDESLKRIFPNHHSLDRRAYARHLRGQGFCVDDQTWSGLRSGPHRSGHGTRTVARDSYDVQIIGPFRRALGLGESCRRLAALLDGLPHRVNFVDYDLGNASGWSDSAFPLKTPGVARINILHLNLDEIPEAFAFLPDIFSSAYTIAFPYWELNAPAACHRLGLTMADEVWAASTFIERMVRPHARATSFIGMSADPRPPVDTRADGRAFLASLGFESGDFIFLTTSDALSWVQRKNVLGAVEAFIETFPDCPHVKLIVKTQNLDHRVSGEQRRIWNRVSALCAGDARIRLINETFEPRSQRLLLLGSDCLVSLHRAEGLGLDILDCLHLGVPVVATGYSGNMDTCAPDTCWLVAHDLVPVPASDYVFVEPNHLWADPRLDSARAMMRDVWENAETRRARVAAAQRRVEARMAPSLVARRIEERLSAILGRTQAAEGGIIHPID